MNAMLILTWFCLVWSSLGIGLSLLVIPVEDHDVTMFVGVICGAVFTLSLMVILAVGS